MPLVGAGEMPKMAIPKQAVYTNLDACDQEQAAQTLFGEQKLEID